MAIKKGDIVVRRLDHDYDELSKERYRVENVRGVEASIRDLTNYMVDVEEVGNLVKVYSTDTFEKGDIVRVREEYQDRYSEEDGYNDLSVVRQGPSNIRAATTVVENMSGDRYSMLNERLYLVRPAVSFKAGDRVVIDPDRMKKYGGDGREHYWKNSGVMVLTEDSGSRQIQTTSNVRYEDENQKESDNVPTRWLKLYVEPEKRVVGAAIKVEDLKIGDKISVSQTLNGIHHVMTGIVGDKRRNFDGSSLTVVSTGEGVFPFESRGAVYTLLEEAPDPYLQKMRDAAVGIIIHGVHFNEYWRKIEADAWESLQEDVVMNSRDVFDSLRRVKFGKLEFFTRMPEE